MLLFLSLSLLLPLSNTPIRSLLSHFMKFIFLSFFIFIFFLSAFFCSPFSVSAETTCLSSFSSFPSSFSFTLSLDGYWKIPNPFPSGDPLVLCPRTSSDPSADCWGLILPFNTSPINFYIPSALNPSADLSFNNFLFYDVNTCSGFTFPGIFYSHSSNIWTVFPYSSIPSICTAQLTEADCNFYPSCTWNGTCNFNDSTDVTIPATSPETCDSVDLGLFTLPSSLNVPCQVRNYFNFVLSSDDSSTVSALLKDIRFGIFSMWPLGYLTRFVAILSSSTTVQPPPLSYTFGSAVASTGITGTYSFQVFDHLNTVATVVDDTNGKNIWDIFMPFWNIVVYLSLFFVIVTHAIPALEHLFKPKDDWKDPKKYKDETHYTS